MKKTFLRTVACVLACILCCLTLAACASNGKPLLTLEKDGIKVSISVNLYQLLLSRTKGNLLANNVTANGITADKEAFWNYSAKFDGENIQTQNDYYRDNILNICRNYLVVLYLFEKEELTLSAAALEEVEKRMDELVKTDGDGSKTKLNAVLSSYGVNYNILKEAYLLDAKADAVREHLYGKNASLIDAEIKDEYLEKNYVHFRQIFLAAYDYVYETDKFGDVIFYHTEDAKKGHIYYDTENGVAGVDENGMPIVDEHGDTVYFVKDSNQSEIAYNPLGEPNRLLTEDGKTYRTEKMSEEEMKALKTRAEALCASLQGVEAADFEAAIKKESTDAADLSEYDDGYYLQIQYDYSALGNDYAHLETIATTLPSLKVGDIVLIPSSTGYHIVRKYAHTKDAYTLDPNQSWATSFYSELTEELFLDKCESFYSEIRLDSALLSTVPPMKEIGINYYY
ncbi:MAG: hypothetical protein IKJ35_02720 [Clostridia bacterium]|nr:hypothetical protein [Clostridia bacterium]